MFATKIARASLQSRLVPSDWSDTGTDGVIPLRATAIGPEMEGEAVLEGPCCSESPLSLWLLRWPKGAALSSFRW